ncbi:MAG: hypothetical protein EOQ63_28880, partial [Mesorhizobium sp.]
MLSNLSIADCSQILNRVGNPCQIISVIRASIWITIAKTEIFTMTTRAIALITGGSRGLGRNTALN